MSQQPLDYQSAPTRRQRPRANRAAIATGVVVVLALVLNGIILASADANPGLGSVFICLVISPVCNGVLLAVSLACTPIFAKRSTRAAIRSYVIVSIVVPLAAVGCTILFLTNMRRY